MTILVIGAGAAGLAAVKSLKDAGLPVQAVERNADVGGQWLYGAEASAVYASAHLISSKRITAFVDFPMPEEWPAYPGHALVLDYLQSFAKHFDLYPLIRFGAEVRGIAPHDGNWRATFGDGSFEDYEAVVIANGHHTEPLLPPIPGEFNGFAMHAKDYKTGDVFDGRRVLVVGMGNTGCDIVVDAVHRAKSVLWSVRGGNHFVPKFIGGKPADEDDLKPGRLVLSRRLHAIRHERYLRSLVGAPEDFGLPKPKHRLYDRIPNVNTTVLQHLGQGDVSLRRPIREFRGDTVVFTDGKEDDVDLVMLATGYEIAFPFLEDLNELNWLPERQAPRLYLNIFPSRPNGLYVAGLLEAAGAGWPACALQTDLIAAFIKVQKENPDMTAEFRDRIAAFFAKDLTKNRGTRGIFVDWLQYKRDLEKMIARLRDASRGV